MYKRQAHNVWGNADLIVKVKEPVEKEYVFFREGLVLFTFPVSYTHLDVYKRQAQGFDAGRGNAHAAFVVLHFFRHTNDHALSLIHI